MTPLQANTVLGLATYCVAITAVSLLGGWLPLLRQTTHVRLQGYLSFSAGVMLGASLGHMLPEAYEMLGPVASLWTLAGVLGLLFVERFFAFHRHEFGSAELGYRAAEKEELRRMSPAQALARIRPEDTAPRTVLATTAIVGLTVHTLAAGMALASSAAAAGSVLDADVVSVFLALVVHKPADSMTVATLLFCGGRSRTTVHLVNLAYALVVPLGVSGFYLLRTLAFPLSQQRAFTGVVLALSAGTFLVIALADLLPELQFHGHSRLRLSLCLLAGVGTMVVPLLIGHG